jgi:hypothetical protein
VASDRSAARPAEVALRAALAASTHDARLAVPPGTMPDVRGMSARDAVRTLARLGVEARVAGDGFVAAQGIAPGSALAPGRVCVLSLSRDVAPTDEPGGTQP